jgi:hypothetical protein
VSKKLESEILVDSTLFIESLLNARRAIIDSISNPTNPSFKQTKPGRREMDENRTLEQLCQDICDEDWILMKDLKPKVEYLEMLNEGDIVVAHTVIKEFVAPMGRAMILGGDKGSVRYRLRLIFEIASWFT